MNKEKARIVFASLMNYQIEILMNLAGLKLRKSRYLNIESLLIKLEGR